MLEKLAQYIQAVHEDEASESESDSADQTASSDGESAASSSPESDKIPKNLSDDEF